MLVRVLCLVALVELALSVDLGRKLGLKDVKDPLPRDCNHYHKLGHIEPGFFKIYLHGDDSPTQLYCAHTRNSTSNVILRRIKGDTTFYRPWTDYEHGFGNVQTDMWAGLKTISSLTQQGNRRLTISIQDWAGNQKQAQYDYFYVADASRRYQLSVSHYNPSMSTLPDDLSHNNGMYFATYDVPDKYHCATQMKGGWWYNYCTYILPTGHYYYGGHYTPPSQYYDGIFYKDYMGFGYSLKYVAMILTT